MSRKIECDPSKKSAKSATFLDSLLDNGDASESNEILGSASLLGRNTGFDFNLNDVPTAKTGAGYGRRHYRDQDDQDNDYDDYDDDDEQDEQDGYNRSSSNAVAHKAAVSRSLDDVRSKSAVGSSSSSSSFNNKRDLATEKKLKTMAGMGKSLLDHDSAIKRRVVYNFQWSGAANEAPPAISHTTDEWAKILGVSKKQVKELYVLAMRVPSGSRWQTSPVPLKVSVSGIQNKLVANVYDVSGNAFTFSIPPDTVVHSGDEEIYKMAPIKEEQLIKYAGASFEDEVNAIHDIGLDDRVLVNPDSRLGQILRANAKQLDLVGGQPSLNRSLQRYEVDKQMAIHVLKRYNDEIIKELPKTNMSAVRLELGRHDNSASFGSLEGVGGVAPSKAKSATEKSIQHSCSFVVEYTIVDPALLQAAKTQ